MKDTIWITILVFSIIIIIGFITFIIYNNNNNKVGKTNQEEINSNIEQTEINEVNDNDIGNYLVSVSASEEKLSPKAYIVFERKYIDCGHTIKTRELVDKEKTNLNKEEIQNQYKDWEIINFSSNEVEFYKEVPGECGEHYIVKEKDGNIAVYIIGLNNEEILMNETEISTLYLPETDKKSLVEGVKIYTKDKLNAYLENFE